MVYLFLSILLFSINNILWKKNISDVNITFLVSYRALFTSLFSIGFALYFHSFDAVTLTDIFRTSVGSIFGVIGLLSMLIVIKEASLHWVSIYNLLGIFFTTCYLIMIEKFEISNSILGAFLIVLGFIYHVVTNTNKQLHMTLKQHLLLLLMTVSFCVSSIIHWKNLAKEIPALVILSNQELVVFSVTFLISCFSLKPIEFVEYYKQYFAKVALMASVIFFALLFSFLGLKLTNPIISSIVFLANPLMTIVLNLIVFKEKLTKHNLVALLFFVLGAFLLHFHSV